MTIFWIFDRLSDIVLCIIMGMHTIKRLVCIESNTVKPKVVVMFFRQDGYMPIPANEMSDASAHYIDVIIKYKRIVLIQALKCYYIVMLAECSTEDIANQIRAFNLGLQNSIHIDAEQYAYYQNPFSWIRHDASTFFDVRLADVQLVDDELIRAQTHYAKLLEEQRLDGLFPIKQLKQSISQLDEIQSQFLSAESSARESFVNERHNKMSELCSCRQTVCLQCLLSTSSIGLCVASLFVAQEVAQGVTVLGSAVCFCLYQRFSRDIDDEPSLELEAIYPKGPYFNQQELEHVMIPPVNVFCSSPDEYRVFPLDNG